MRVVYPWQMNASVEPKRQKLNDIFNIFGKTIKYLNKFL